MNEKINIWALLAKRFPAGEWVLLQEVRDAAGFHASNAADGIAFNLWPSRGLEVHGIEVKSFRSDWLREWKNPKKAENIFQYCDRFWLVANGEKIVLKEELPPTWGLLQVSGSKLKTIIEAPKLTPEPLSRHFVASLLKRATKGMIATSSIEQKFIEHGNAAVERFKSTMPQSKSRAEEQLKRLEVVIKSFEESSGIKISQYYYRESAGELGALVKLLSDTNNVQIKKQLQRVSQNLNLINKNIGETITQLENMDRDSKLPADDEKINAIRHDLLTMFNQSIGWKFRIKGSPLIDEVVGVDEEMMHVCGKMYGNFHVDLCELTNEETHLAN